MSEQDSQAIGIPIEWHVSEETPCQYATNLVVQHTEHEFVISFFNTLPPLVIGSQVEVRRQLEQLETVRAECVGRLIVAPARMPEFVKVLNDNVERYLSRSEELE